MSMTMEGARMMPFVAQQGVGPQMQSVQIVQGQPHLGHGMQGRQVFVPMMMQGMQGMQGAPQAMQVLPRATYISAAPAPQQRVVHIPMQQHPGHPQQQYHYVTVQPGRNDVPQAIPAGQHHQQQYFVQNAPAQAVYARQPQVVAQAHPAPAQVQYVAIAPPSPATPPPAQMPPPRHPQKLTRNMPHSMHGKQAAVGSSTPQRTATAAHTPQAGSFTQKKDLKQLIESNNLTSSGAPDDASKAPSSTAPVDYDPWAATTDGQLKLLAAAAPAMHSTDSLSHANGSDNESNPQSNSSRSGFSSGTQSKTLTHRSLAEKQTLAVDMSHPKSVFDWKVRVSSPEPLDDDEFDGPARYAEYLLKEILDE
ncbi:hypothetical protein DIPPA_25641 [Diplonema papillatum]|nr:hypothetical protein DIPPA_25641 [Diplonema papillatum]|eukprot:gene10075-15488_t